MNDDPSRPLPPVNPFAKPGVAPLDITTLPPWHPFEGPPEPKRATPAPMFEAFRRAYCEWRQYLPHGLSLAEYEPYRSDWICDLAIISATKPLQARLPADKALAAAQIAADEAFTTLPTSFRNMNPTSAPRSDNVHDQSSIGRPAALPV